MNLKKLKIMEALNRYLITFIAATVIMLAATSPATAQRRSSPGLNTKVENTDKKESKNQQGKATDSKKENERNNAVSNSGRRSQQVNVRTQQNPSGNNHPQTKSATKGNINERNRQGQRENNGSVNRPGGNPANATPAARQAPQGPNSNNNRYSTSQRGNSSNKSTNVNQRGASEHNRVIYRVDTKDNRYAPGKNYRGSSSYWTGNHSSHYIHYSRKGDDFYKRYDHRKYAHWDRSWETYRWNVNSWREYYNGYHPHSYRYHKFYYYHPGYGHAIRKFTYKPDYFVHNNIRYYNYNGHFFRHFKGVGYVLVDMPYGVVFHQLPKESDKVYINGFLYFRIGNLFFERSPRGYALIHYPERYFALEGGFFNGGYYVPDAYYLPY